MEWQLQDYVKITLHGVPGSDYSLTWNCHLLMARWPFDLYFIMERLWHVSILIIIYRYCLSPSYVQIVWKIERFYGFFFDSLVDYFHVMIHTCEILYRYIVFFENQSCQNWKILEKFYLKTGIDTILWSKFKRNLKWSLQNYTLGITVAKGYNSV